MAPETHRPLRTQLTQTLARQLGVPVEEGDPFVLLVEVRKIRPNEPAREPLADMTLEEAAGYVGQLNERHAQEVARLSEQIVALDEKLDQRSAENERVHERRDELEAQLRSELGEAHEATEAERGKVARIERELDRLRAENERLLARPPEPGPAPLIDPAPQLARHNAADTQPPEPAASALAPETALASALPSPPVPPAPAPADSGAGAGARSAKPRGSGGSGRW